MKTRRRNASENHSTISRRSAQMQASENQGGYSETLPTDLILEILTRLPTKSIARFRCVSKPWESMLRGPYFTELYLSRSCDRPQLLLACRTYGDDIFFFSAPQDENSSLVTSTYHMKSSISGHSKIRGSVRGFSLVCGKHLRNTKGRNVTGLVICNPSTRQCLSLPKVRTRRVGVHSFIGYDPVEKQIKVLAMTCASTEEGILSQEHQVLTLGTKKTSWRMVECCIPHYRLCSQICINGVLYYTASSVSRLSTVSMIVSFDVRSEKFSLIEIDEEMTISYISVLVNYKGKLGVILSDIYVDRVSREIKSLEMWVLEDPEKHEWSKHVSELPSGWQNDTPDIDLCYAGVTSTNEIVLCPNYIVVPFFVFYYNIESNTIRRVEIKGMDALESCRLDASINHVEDVKLLQLFS